jgi:DNA primase large subunit
VLFSETSPQIFYLSPSNSITKMHDDEEEEDTRDALTILDYIKYPFLQGARDFARKIAVSNIPLGDMLATKDGKVILELAKLRIMTALGRTITTPPTARNEIKLASFYFARRLLTCAKSPKSLVEKLIECEAGRSVDYLKTENSQKREKILQELGIDVKTKTISLIEYLPLTVRLATKHPEWKLINKTVSKGRVYIGYKDLMDTILKEKIKDRLRVGLYDPGEDTLSNPPPDVTRILGPIADEMLGGYYKTLSMDVGEVTPSNYPPCIIAIIDELARGDNPTHPARFALVTFANSIGLKEEEIVEMFKNVRDFQMEQTLYQVRHISGTLGGTKYSAPACAKLRTFGLCKAGDNPLCAAVAHPLGYYDAKQKGRQPRKT